MTDALLVRRCRTRDATTLRALRLEALGDTPEAFGSTLAEASEWSPERWVAMATDWNFYLGYYEGVPAGMASGGWHEHYPGTHWLFGMYVSPSARGTGLAGALVDAVAAWARAEGGTALHLHVTESVARARRFYEKMGFVPTDEVTPMHRDPSLQLMEMVKYFEP